MQHVVTNEPYVCPKCLRKNMGSAEAILDLLICPKCAAKYRSVLMPAIEKLVRDYFQPERSKREDSITAEKAMDGLVKQAQELKMGY